MRKCLRWITLAAAVIVALCVTALAAGEKNGTTISDKFAGSTATFAEGSDMIHVTVSSSSITPDEQYLIVMAKGLDEEKPIITEESILYINQQAAGTGDNQGTLTFDVYPSDIQNSVIWLSGEFSDNRTGPVALAVVRGESSLGDVNGNGRIDAGDATLVLRYSVKLATDKDGDFSVADVNKRGGITSADASMILQHVAGLITSFDK